MQREAYSHEVIAFGFWPGDANVPAPHVLHVHRARAGGPHDHGAGARGASWVPSGSGHMGVLPYDAVRTADDPDAALLSFLRSGYEAGTRTAHWDAAALAHTP